MTAPIEATKAPQPSTRSTPTRADPGHPVSGVIHGPTSDIPVFEMREFQHRIKELLGHGFRLASFFGSPSGEADAIYLNAVFTHDTQGALKIIRTSRACRDSYHSLTLEHPEFHCFERELHEHYGIRPTDHPWLKPIRYSRDGGRVESYPFYQLEGKEVHEVGVGPVHAGVIEPGHFRFMCHGETVHHLEIQLGFQHRGVEGLLLRKDPRHLAPLVETIAGDSSIAHTWAYCMAWEALCGAKASREISLVRGIALELERVAMHLSGLAGLSNDIAFLAGSAAYGRLRTAAINTSMRVCGSRFGRGWLRPGKARWLSDLKALEEIRRALKGIETDISAVHDLFRASKTVRRRLRNVGRISQATARQMGFVGMTARCAGVPIDLRSACSRGLYGDEPIQRVVEESGDCWARAVVRIREIDESLRWLFSAMAALQRTDPNLNEERLQVPLGEPAKGSFALSMIEGWRGEVLHYLETHSDGKRVHYRVQDPSLRNWLAVALAVRGNDISDFPICNKSFDLSYCGQDL